LDIACSWKTAEHYIDCPSNRRQILNVGERIVVSAWERQTFDPSTLQSLGLTLIYRGVPSDAGGPDYQDAIFESDDQTLLSGDVEFHVRTSDWYHHGHHQDARYNGVLLHVVWEGDSLATVRQDGSQVPTLVVGSSVPSAKVDDSWSLVDQLLRHPCVDCFVSVETEDLMRRIRLAGLARFRERKDALSADISATSADDAAYTAILEALGYASNRSTFRQLAEIVPFGWLMSIPPEARTSALLDAARLGPPSAVPPPARLPDGDWRLARIRPGNHPETRLRGVVVLLERLGPDLAQQLVKQVKEVNTPSELRPRLIARCDGHGVIGAGRADELAVSVVLPLVAALDSEDDTAESLFLRYPAPPSNRWTRVMLGIMSDAGHHLGTLRAAEHQGLHHLYHRHCRYERGAGCPICAL
jgi:Protein of unknown function (DUF2851)